jgi:hypothetical protein
LSNQKALLVLFGSEREYFASLALVRLIVAHKILISASLFLAILLWVRGIRLYEQIETAFELGMG